MCEVISMLVGGDRRSIGRVSEAVALVLARPELFGELIDGMLSDDPVLRMRCADAAEKVTAVYPELLTPYGRMLLDLLALSEQQEIRWHLAPMLLRLTLSEADEHNVMEILTAYTHDQSSIVKTMAMQAMADLAIRNQCFLPEVLRNIEALAATGTPAMKARGRRLLKTLAEITGTDR